MERLKVFENGVEMWLSTEPEYSEIVVRFSENEWEYPTDSFVTMSEKHCEKLEVKRAEALLKMPKRVEMEVTVVNPNLYSAAPILSHRIESVNPKYRLRCDFSPTLFPIDSKVKVIIEEVQE